MRVVVCGAGIGGLALAQGLRGAGHEVVVLERDPGLERTGGYRLHLDDGACAALGRLLPAPVWQAVVDSGSGAGGASAMHVTDRRLRPLAAVPFPADEQHLMIGRVPLRVLLGHGLDDVVLLGRTVVAVEQGESGAAALTSDGERFEADLVVAADGARSTVARQLAGGPLALPTGLVGLAGRAALNDALDGRAPALLRRGPALGVGPRGVGLFVTRHDPSGCPSRHAPHDVGPVPVPEQPCFVWGVILSAPRVPEATRERAVAALAGWSPWVRALVGASDPASVAGYEFLAADPERVAAPWSPGRVAGLGDALHAMPPTGGQSASTAVLDAADLLDTLASTEDDLGRLPSAVDVYHRDVMRRGRSRLRESLAPARWIQRTSHPFATPIVVGSTALAAAGRRLVRGGGS